VKNLEKLVRNGVLTINAWPTGKPIEEIQAELGLDKLALMATNENPLGPSPKAVEAMRAEIYKVNRYPQGPCTYLRRKVAARLGIGEDMIIFSNGADNCLRIICYSFLNSEDEVIVAHPSFPVYGIVARIMGAVPVEVPLKDHVHDLRAIAEKIGPRTKLIFVCNPNNPTGTIVRRKELNALVKALPDHVVLILDEAYFEFVDDEEYPNALDYIREGRNVVGLRTFSKLYGIAGVRSGYTLGCPERTAVMERVREPFPVSRVAEAAALGAVDDDEFKSKVLANNEESKRFLRESFDGLELSYAQTHTNFMFVDLKIDAKATAQALLEQGYLIRPGTPWKHPTFARITFGTMEENRGFVSALGKVLRR
jgi:histidinol-phosphate aminotransferase